MIELIDKHKTWLMVEDIKNRNPDRKAMLREVQRGIKTMPSIEPTPQWIPCNEKLPEDEYVLISKKSTKISGNKWSVAIATRTKDPRSRKIQWRDSGFGVIQDDKVLAWMPLPEPYQPESEEQHG